MNALRFIVLMFIVTNGFALNNDNFIFTSMDYNKYYTNKQLKVESLLTSSKENSLYVGDVVITKNSKFYSNVAPGQEFDSSTFLSIRQLSYERLLDTDISITGGVLPFNYGSLSKYDTLYSTEGNGLEDMGSVNITGMFLTYTRNKYTTTLGYGVKDLLFNTDVGLGKNYPIEANKQKYLFKNSKGIFIISKYKGKNRFIETDFYRIKLIVNDIVYGNVNLLTMGFRQNNFVNSNIVYYGVLNLSKPDNVNKTYVKNKLGESIKLGISKFSLLPYTYKENVSTLILRYITNNYVNFSFGQPFGGYTFANVGFDIGVSEKVFITNKFIALFKVNHLFSNKTIQPGTLNYYNSSSNKIKNRVYFGLEYKF